MAAILYSPHFWLLIVLATSNLLVQDHAHERMLRCDKFKADVDPLGVEWQQDACKQLWYTIDLSQQVFEEVSQFTDSVSVSKSLVRTIDYGERSTLDSLTFYMAIQLVRMTFSPNRLLKILAMRDCLIRQLPPTLAHLQGLEFLDLQNCRIAGSFDLGQLLRNPKLLAVHLEGNRIDDLQLHLDYNTTGSTSNIRRLALTNNFIQTLNLSLLAPFCLLSDLWVRNNSVQAVVGQVHLPNLTTVNLEINKLLTLNLDPSHLSAISRILVHNNALHSLPTLSSSTALTVLDMRWNHLDFLNVTTLMQLAALEIVDLSSNAIANVTPTDQTVALPRLKVLNLSYNRLEALNFDLWQFPRLLRLHLSGNPLLLLADLFALFPTLNQLHCFQMDLECGWLQRQLPRIVNYTLAVATVNVCPGVSVQIESGKCIPCICSAI